MRDPHIHVEKMPMPGFGHVRIRELFTEALGVTSDLPKTVGTGCGKRRSLTMTSTIPERVTCLACREYARAEQIKWAEMAEALLGYDDDPAIRQALATAHTTREELAEQARERRAMAARFEVAQ